MAAGKKNAKRLGAHIVFLDESGFLLIPLVLKTWAPRGCTPICRHRYRRDKISVISCVTVSPKRHRLGLCFDFYQDNITSLAVRDFLRELLKHLRGHIVVVLDNARIHRGEEVRALLKRTRRLHLEPLPPYAPELNPDEAVWAHAKKQLANGCPDSVPDLHADLFRTFVEIACSRRLLRGFIKQSGLPLLLP